ncbi:MAG TPA: 2-isopropylmalate synthase, partial [Spirochaetia bacterium]|nr:2-isopropylmalate synthase [Spirochaetia bacterium]
MSRRIEILDTTLRDGNKLPFVVLSPGDRVLLALQLARLGVDIIEAGWPSASAEDADCVSRVCSEVEGPHVAALARALPRDVDAALAALKHAAHPYLHVYMGVSPHFLRAVLKTGEKDALASVDRCVKMGKKAGARVQFSLSEAPHATPQFLREAVAAARDAGADVINIADTNGILSPEDAAGLVGVVQAELGSRPGAQVGIHCHNDLGLAA